VLSVWQNIFFNLCPVKIINSSISPNSPTVSPCSTFTLWPGYSWSVLITMQCCHSKIPHLLVLPLSSSQHYAMISFFFFFLKILFIWEQERERDWEHKQWGRGRRRSRLPTEQGARCWGLIPGPGDHDLSRRQTLNKVKGGEGATQVPVWLALLTILL